MAARATIPASTATACAWAATATCTSSATTAADSIENVSPPSSVLSWARTSSSVAPGARSAMAGLAATPMSPSSRRAAGNTVTGVASASSVAKGSTMPTRVAGSTGPSGSGTSKPSSAACSPEIVSSVNGPERRSGHLDEGWRGGELTRLARLHAVAISPPTAVGEPANTKASIGSVPPSATRPPNTKVTISTRSSAGRSRSSSRRGRARGLFDGQVEVLPWVGGRVAIGRRRGPHGAGRQRQHEAARSATATASNAAATR